MNLLRNIRISIYFILAFTFALPTSWAFTTGTDPVVRNSRSDVVLAATSKSAKPQFRRRTVRIETNEEPGTIIIDSNTKYLYLVQNNGKAIRYGISVGRPGFEWGGTVRVGRKAEWPSWTPPARMIARERAKGNIIPPFMKGGINNPLGARAMYLYRGGQDTIYRIHGTNQPWTIGYSMSSGCIRLVNKDVEHLYARVGVGTKVIVIREGSDSSQYYTARRTIFGA